MSAFATHPESSKISTCIRHMLCTALHWLRQSYMSSTGSAERHIGVTPVRSSKASSVTGALITSSIGRLCTPATCTAHNKACFCSFTAGIQQASARGGRSVNIPPLRDAATSYCQEGGQAAQLYWLQDFLCTRSVQRSKAGYLLHRHFKELHVCSVACTYHHCCWSWLMQRW